MTDQNTMEFEDYDVDAPELTDAEDTVDETAPTAEGDKPAKVKKESTRPPVPEGFISPVAFAKYLSEHLTAKLREAGQLGPDEVKTVAPQVVYSYIKNNGPESKHPFPTHQAEGRAVVLKVEEGLQWWDEKDERVAKGKAEKANKAAQKAAKANEPTETANDAVVEEAE